MKNLITIFLLLISLNASAGWVYDEIRKIWYNTETGEIIIIGDDDADDDVGSIMIFNAGGQVQDVVSSSSLNENTIKIKTDNYEEGVYIIRIENKSKTKYFYKKLFIR